MKALLASLLLLTASAHSAELQVTQGDHSHTWSSAELLNHPQARDIEIPADVAYKRTMHYRAVPIAVLLDRIAPGDHLDMEVVALQVAGDQFGQGAVVFDQENIRHRCLGIWIEVGLYAIPVGAGLPAKRPAQAYAEYRTQPHERIVLHTFSHSPYRY